MTPAWYVKNLITWIKRRSCFQMQRVELQSQQSQVPKYKDLMNGEMLKTHSPAVPSLVPRSFLRLY
jgi:hypothetical protein